MDTALSTLKAENLSVSGLVCHVGKEEDRQKLIDHVRTSRLYICLLKYTRDLQKTQYKVDVSVEFTNFQFTRSIEPIATTKSFYQLYGNYNLTIRKF